MVVIMSRREAQQKVDSLYKDIYDIYRILKSWEGRLDDKRVQILQYLERIDKLDDDGYRAYAAMLTDLLKKIKNHGVRSRNLPNLGMTHGRDVLYAKTEPYFTVAHVKPEPVKDIPESAWEKYVQRDLFNEQIYIGPRPLSRTIELGTNYLIRIGDFFPAPYDAQRKAPSLNDMAPEYDQDRDGIKVEGLSNVNRIRRRASFTKLNNM